MNLKKQYQRLFKGRQEFAKANTLITNDILLKEQMDMGSPGREMTYPEPLDIEYFSDEINELLEKIDEFHQELGTQVEMKGDESGNYEYETMEKQLSRYLEGSKSQLLNLQKYLERQKGKGL